MKMSSTRGPAAVAIVAALMAIGCSTDNQAYVSATATPAPRTQSHTAASSTASGQISGQIPTASGSAQPSPTPTAAPTVAPITVSSVSVSPGGATLDLPGSGSGSPIFPSSVQLSALVYLSDSTSTNSVAWSSLATSTATVSVSGLVSAVGTGSADIVAASVQNPSITATVSIVVQANGSVGITID